MCFRRLSVGLGGLWVMEASKEATQMGRGLIQGSSGEDDKNTE